MQPFVRIFTGSKRGEKVGEHWRQIDKTWRHAIKTAGELSKLWKGFVGSGQSRSLRRVWNTCKCWTKWGLSHFQTKMPRAILSGLLTRRWDRILNCRCGVNDQ